MSEQSTFAFYKQIYGFYQSNKGKIRSRYNDLTKKYLAYNDSDDNKGAYLWKPQFEALEIYVFIKEFLNNPQVYEMFDDWRNKRGCFDSSSYYSVNKGGQGNLFENVSAVFMSKLFEQMKKYKEDYPNYIYALTMGLGKTTLIATCIYYEFLLANKYPKDKRYCHNALVFAPDKTVLQSLKEIITLDKSKILPPEYANKLDSNIQFHFLDDSTILNTLDDSDFNIIISNTQKIIVKKKHKESTATDLLFASGSVLASLYDEDDDESIEDDSELIENQRFKKICRLPQLGIYVDEAHHLFGSDLEKQIRSDTANKTSLRDTINMIAKNTSLVACYNYTGTPYVNNQLLPEVVYAYGLNESISEGYLKQANPLAYENVKSNEFLCDVIERFWNQYGNKVYEKMPAKLAIFASTIDEANNEVRPIIENKLYQMGIPLSKLLINVGDEKITKNDDIRDFNNLDVPGTQGCDKQFIILVGKGREGWNCRSLLAVAMYRSPKSKIFVLQATMRCLRKLTDNQLTATVFLSKENFDILDVELRKNFNMDIKDLGNNNSKQKKRYAVRVMPPQRVFTLKEIRHEYKLEKKEYREPVDFGLSTLNLSEKYGAKLYEKPGINSEQAIKVESIDHVKANLKYSDFQLVGELSRYLNVPCLVIAKILRESRDGIDHILDCVNKYNEVIFNELIPVIFSTLYKVECVTRTADKDIVLLREPKNSGYYEFSAFDELVIKNDYHDFSADERKKTFHADTYCFDSNPEKLLFIQYVKSSKVKEIYFTGMFTSGQGELCIPYYDPESQKLRHYYPDFFAVLNDGSYQLIEVKGDNKIDDTIVKAKADAANEVAVESSMKYIMYAGSEIEKTNVLNKKSFDSYVLPSDSEVLYSAESHKNYGEKKNG